MSVITQLNSAPYFDNYTPEQKDYLRILFRPGYAVQVRELNQLQSILQNQIERFGNHIFKNGSLITGGLTTVDLKTAKYLKLNTSTISISEYLNTTIEGVTSGAKGYVTVVFDASDSEPLTLIYKPVNGSEFVAGENIRFENTTTTLGTIKTLAQDVDALGNSSTVSIDNGIFFTKGMFVICPSQTIAISKYTNDDSKIIGLKSEITIYDEEDDNTLLDNASGTYNYAAPGAHRLKVTLTLTSKDTTYVDDIDTFIPLIEIKNGELYRQIVNTQYNDIIKLLARRTYDESGDYTVRPFVVNMVSHSTGATGLYNTAKISSGKAYVKGYEVETISTRSLDIPKARTTKTGSGKVPVIYGNNLLVKIDKGLPNVSSLEKVYLYDSGATGPFGNARVRDISYYDSTGPTYNISLFDINVTAANRTFSETYKIGDGSTYSSSSLKFSLWGATGPIEINTANTSDSKTTSLVYDLGYSATKNITDPTITFNEKYTKSVAASSFTFTHPTNGSFVIGNTSTALRNAYYSVVDNSGTRLDGSLYTVSGSGGDITFAFGGSTGPISIIAPVEYNVNDSSLTIPKTENKVPNFEGYVVEATSIYNPTNIKLPSYASGTDDYYNNGKLKIVSGKGKSDTLYDITNYDQATKTITVNTSVDLDTTSYVKISPYFVAATDGTGIKYSSTGNQTISLGVADAIRVIKIITNVSDPTMEDWFDASKDVTDSFIFDNGQRDDYYDIASITPKPGTTITTPIVVFFDYFSHNTTSGKYYSVNSYTNKDVPRYYIDSKGKVINLFNTIDCRPVKSSTTTFATAAPANQSTISFSSEYYLGRLDKIAVNTNGNFINIVGIPSDTPKYPKDLDDALTLYKLYIPPYTYSPSDIKLEYVENKRYTMKDIGKLENRIDNLEYYVTLSALEQNTTLFNVKDTDGLDRFKNGILVDSFTGHNVGDVYNKDYRVSMDMAAGEARPPFIQKAYKLNLDEADSDPDSYTKRGNLITCRVDSDVEFISQPIASKTVNVNPFSVFTYKGQVELTPTSDFWKDTRMIPTNVNNVNGVYDNLVAGNNPYGTIYNQWNGNWFGKPEAE